MAKKAPPAPDTPIDNAEANAGTAFGMPLPGHLKDSAQQIWLAGLGAFSKVQAEGGKVFDALVSDGLELQRQTQALAEERIAEAAKRFSQLGSELTNKATGSVDRLENIFEDRVAKALKKLGVPSAQDVAALQARIDELQQALARLAPPPAPPQRATAARQPAAARTAARKTAPRKSAPRQP